MLIFEGCDGTGKSTLAKYVMAELSKIGEKFEHKKEGPTKLGFPYYLTEACNSPIDSIRDRFLLGEVVYPIVKKDGRVPLSCWQVEMVERVLQVKGSILIACDTNKKRIKQVFNKRGEDFVGEADIPIIKNIYERLFKDSMLNMAYYDFDKTDNPKRLAKYIVEMWLMARRRASYFEQFKSVGSTATNRIMLVGDTSNAKQEISSHAFTCDRGCSPWLAEMLSMTNNRNQVYITNANKTKYEYENKKMLAREMEVLEPRRILAMGEQAGNLVKSITRNYAETYHPQYWKRFMNDERHKFINLINLL